MKKDAIIDADAHVLETETTWSYIDKSNLKYRPILYSSTQKPDRQYWVLEDKIVGVRFPTLTEQEIKKFSEVTARKMVTDTVVKEMNDIALRLKHLDELKIDIQVLHNTIWLEGITENVTAEIVLSESWNRWMADIWKQGNNRLFWSCVVPTLNIPEALQQMQEFKKYGAVAVFLRSFERNFALTDDYFYPIYDLATKLDMAVITHASNGNLANSELLKSHPGGFVRNAFSIFRVPVMISCYDLLMSEVLQQFPHLRWGFIEATSQWVPWVIHEVKTRLMEDNIQLSPTVFRDHHMYVSCQEDDDLQWILNYTTDHGVVTGTDYGHLDPASNLDAISIIQNRPDLSPQQKHNILHENPKKLYGLK